MRLPESIRVLYPPHPRGRPSAFGVNIGRMARRIGVSESHLHHILHGTRNPSYRVIGSLAQAWKMDVGEVWRVLRKLRKQPKRAS